MRIKHAFIYFGSGFVASLVIIGSIIVAYSQHLNFALQKSNLSQTPTELPKKLFGPTMTQMTYEYTTEAGSELWVSPDSKWLIFEARNTGDKEKEQRYFLSSTLTGERKEISGRPIMPWTHSQLVITNPGADLHVFATDSTDSPLEVFPNIGPAVSAQFSPDESTIMVAVDSGLWRLDRASGRSTIISEDSFSSLAWYGDSQTILASRLTRTIGAIPQHDLGIVDAQNGSWESFLKLDFPTTTIQNIEWLITDQLALVTTGWDDGEYLYLVDTATETYRLVAETSEGGSFDFDRDMERIGFITHEPGRERLVIMSYGGDVILSRSFYGLHTRHNIKIQNPQTALYQRSQPTTNQTEVVILDIPTGQEKILFAFDHYPTDLKLIKHPDTIFWITPTKDRIIGRPLPN